MPKFFFNELIVLYKRSARPKATHHEEDNNKAWDHNVRCLRKWQWHQRIISWISWSANFWRLAYPLQSRDNGAPFQLGRRIEWQQKEGTGWTSKGGNTIRQNCLGFLLCLNLKVICKSTIARVIIGRKCKTYEGREDRPRSIGKEWKSQNCFVFREGEIKEVYINMWH